MSLNIKDRNIMRKLTLLQESGEFKKYPVGLLRYNCTVKVNPDDYLRADEFMIISSYSNLPRSIFIYGKGKDCNSEDNIYLNYWLDVFFKTIENGKIYPHQFEKSQSKLELTVGISRIFRGKAYHYNTWTRKNIIEFLSCLLDTSLEEANYQQEDLLEEMVA